MATASTRPADTCLQQLLSSTAWFASVGGAGVVCLVCARLRYTAFTIRPNELSALTQSAIVKSCVTTKHKHCRGCLKKPELRHVRALSNDQHGDTDGCLAFLLLGNVTNQGPNTGPTTGPTAEMYQQVTTWIDTLN